MTSNDYSKFAEAWANAHELMPAGKVLSPGAMMACIDALKQYPLPALLLAIKKHMQTARFAPAPKDIIDLLDIGRGRVGADEAWAICDKDESRTIVWTEEMRQAYGIAYDLMADGDRIGARMAFKSSYERLCNEAVMLDRPVKWSVSLGSDKQDAAQELKHAVELGRIAQDLHDALLPGPVDGGLIAKMITGTVTELPGNKQNFKKRWAEISLALAQGKARLDEKEKQRREDETQKRLAFEAKKQQAAQIAGLIKKH
jgi:hypothetical protein